METRIPPPVVMVLVGAAMWLVARWTPALTLSLPGMGWLAIATAAAGIALAVAAAWALHRHRTTINPMRPQDSSHLVDTGPFAWSRNPIYLADLILLAAWAVYLGNPLTLALLPVFVLYINRFQIRPEEAALEQHFGGAFRVYRRHVRRWL
ncbi:methyltransferase family protein [Aquisalimonas asiatica]|uniref:Protein-S-isoprenylcysteine O-methyltransferase Ste14 n=1 Tax=Aquisalimonas asiatica TaxID=406100 RepID=A0A1H8SPS6_9GAMM|nr:isoprenylcysteine carboxylmethyltransferase family protein [Aquisalimonas asiatica]SEO80183.1 Protein-S-isoprenylcysteine O-methyltransferase Ste14 [Aquisalimonas asiatica]